MPKGESLDEWVEEKECRTGDCTFIGLVDVTVWPGTGQADEWTCPGCGAHHVEEPDDA